MFEKIKQFYISFMASRVGNELKDILLTFSAIYIGSITLTPAFNALVGTDLPTVQQFQNIGPALLDAFYRSIWMTILVETGLVKYRNKTTGSATKNDKDSK